LARSLLLQSGRVCFDGLARGFDLGEHLHDWAFTTANMQFAVAACAGKQAQAHERKSAEQA